MSERASKVNTGRRELPHSKLCASDRSLLCCFTLGVPFRLVSLPPFKKFLLADLSEFDYR